MNMTFYWCIPEEIRLSWGRIPFDRIAEQNREFIAGLDDPTFDRGTQMDATRNNATMYLQDATEFICIYPQGLFPRELAAGMVASSRELLERLSKDYPPDILKPVEHAFNRYFGCWYGPNIQRVPEELFAKRLFESMNNMLEAIDTFNVYVATNPVPKTSPSVSPAKASRDRASDGDLTQDDVAADFGVTRQTVANWERGKKKNPWGYYKELRLNSDLRGAYNLLAGSAKAYNRAKAEAKHRGVRFRTSFVAFNEHYLKHSNSIERD